MPIEKSTVLDDVIIMIIDIEIITNHLTKLFFEKRKKGVSIIIVMANHLDSIEIQLGVVLMMVLQTNLKLVVKMALYQKSYYI